MKNKNNLNDDKKVYLFRITKKVDNKKYHSFYLAWFYNDRFYYEAFKVPFVVSLAYFVGRSIQVKDIDEMKQVVCR